jgi:hypothetical protein
VRPIKADLLLRSITTHMGVDDSFLAGQIRSRTVSGRVAYYTVPVTGDNAFTRCDPLIMPSAYAKYKVLFNLGQDSLKDCIKQFATSIFHYLDEWGMYCIRKVCE